MTIEKHSYGDKADTGGKKAKVVELCAIITRAQFEELWMSMFFKSVGPVGKCLNEAKVDNVQIQEVVLVSKSTRIPIIQHLLKDYFDEKKLYTSINQDDSMACDTTVLDAILIGNGDENVQELLVVDVSLLDLGVETVGRTIIVLISRNATNSAMEEQTFPTYSDHQRENVPIEELSRLNYCNWHWHFYGCSIQPVIQARFNGPSN
ncbi:heat shock 70 kDa protein-like [Capsicum annuum]|uniref:heat shock 70 kDa protein-like n=1 Tax=Capsicum annuum TaxID=4072 RepID=UPI001FB0A2F1|nr:heat shock 70 kDa protein-like [Capsicum annuum]